MAENIPGENGVQSGNAGHRTIKLTPMNMPSGAEESVGTSTVKVSKIPVKPQNPIPPVAFAGDLEKTQAIPIKKMKPVASAQPVSSPFLKKAGPGTTQTLTPKTTDTATKGIPLSGVASVPKPEPEDIDQTSTVRLNRPSPKPMATHSTPISTKSTPIPQNRKTFASPLGATPPEADAAPTVKIGVPPSVQAPSTATGGIRVGTSTTGIKLNSIPAKKINLSAPVGTATTGIKVGTATTGIKLGPKPVIPGAATIKLAPPSAADNPETSTQAIKVDGVPTPGASTVKLKAPVTPAASAEPSSVDKVEETPAPAAEEPVVEENVSAEAPAAEEPAAESAAEPAGEAAASETSAPEENAAEENAKPGKKAKKVRVKKVSLPGENPHWAFTVSSCVAMICLLIWAILIAVQFLNQWQGMEIQLPGLQFLSLGR